MTPEQIEEQHLYSLLTLATLCVIVVIVLLWWFVSGLDARRMRKFQQKQLEDPNTKERQSGPH